MLLPLLSPPTHHLGGHLQEHVLRSLDAHWVPLDADAVTLLCVGRDDDGRASLSLDAAH